MNKADFVDLVQDLNTELDIMKHEIEIIVKSDYSNKSSMKRLRKNTLNFSKISKQFRKESVKI